MEKENGEWDEEQKRDEAFAIESLSLIMTVMLYSCHFNAVPHWATNHPLSVYLSREKEIKKLQRWKLNYCCWWPNINLFTVKTVINVCVFFNHYEQARCVIQLIANHNSGHERGVSTIWSLYFKIKCKL